MTTKRSNISNPSPAYENRLDRDPKSKTFGQKLHYPLHADGSVSSEGFRKASDALRTHKYLTLKAEELASAEGYTAHDEGLDILSNPYTNVLGRAWAAGWNRADADGVIELDGQQEADTSDSDDMLEMMEHMEQVGD